MAEVGRALWIPRQRIELANLDSHTELETSYKMVHGTQSHAFNGSTTTPPLLPFLSSVPQTSPSVAIA